MKSKYEKRTQIGWSVSLEHSRYVSGVWIKGFNAFLNGDLEKWYWCFKTLREITNQDLSNDEIANLDVLEKKILPLFKAGKVLPQNRNTFTLEVTKYQRIIQKALRILGYFPSREDTTKLSF